MEIIKTANIDWLGKKWYFIGVSIFLAVIGSISLLVQGLAFGVDFTGGTLVYLKFSSSPNFDLIRQTLSGGDIGAQEVTRFDEPDLNQVQVKLARLEDESTADLSVQSRRVYDALRAVFDKTASADQSDLNRASRSEISSWLQEKDPEKVRPQMSLDEFTTHTQEIAGKIVQLRTDQGGLIKDFSELAGLGLPAAVTDALKADYYLGNFAIISTESVGPKVGRELRDRAQNAVLFSLLGMLVYVAFRFRPIYGVAAIVALFHDVFITLGFFSLSGKDISLTVIAGLLTLVGYSINDTIVIFDRVRENLRLMRRSSLATVINTSINQTLNRTVLTSGMTFLAVFSLYLLGGEALDGFAFALVIGIIIGTYSSIAIASPIVLWWENFRENRRARS